MQSFFIALRVPIVYQRIQILRDGQVTVYIYFIYSKKKETFTFFYMFYMTNQPVAPTPIKPTPSHQMESKSCDFRLTAGVLDLFSRARLIFFLRDEAEEAVGAGVALPPSVGSAVGFMVMVGSIMGGLYAKYNGAIGEPSN